jgi:hypothetical protein
MAKQTIGIGAAPNDGNGNQIRTAFGKVNDNFDELYAGSNPYLVAVNAMGALSIDTSKRLNTKSISADSTFTFSGTPASGTWFGLLVTNTDSSNPFTLTIPTSYSFARQVAATTVTIQVSGKLFLEWFYDGSGYTLFGESVGLNASAIVGAHNFTEVSLRNFRAAMAQSRFGLVNVLLCGDSVTGNPLPRGWGNYFERVVSAQVDSPIGRPENPRLGTNLWTIDGTDNWGANRTGVYFNTAATYGPAVGDRLKIHWQRGDNSIYGVVTVLCDGVSVGTFDCSGSPRAIVEQTYMAPSLGTHTWTLSPATGKYGSVNVAQSLTGDPSTGVQVYNFGYPGHFIDNLIGDVDAFDSLRGTFSGYSPCLVILTPAGYTTSGDAAQVTFWKNGIQTFITQAKASNCDVLLVMPCVDHDGGGTATAADYQTALIELATTNDCPYIDFLERWGGFTTANLKGYMSDDIHPTQSGSSEMADAIFDALHFPRRVVDRGLIVSPNGTRFHIVIDNAGTLSTVAAP